MKYLRYFLILLVFFFFSCVETKGQSYEIKGIEVQYEREGIAYSKDEVKQEFERIASLFDPYFVSYPLDVLSRYDTVFFVTVNLPTYKGNEVVALTYPSVRTIVWHRKFLDEGGGLYELKLHFCHLLFPGRVESADVRWMMDEGIIDYEQGIHKLMAL